jgi:hypothetical protein
MVEGVGFDFNNIESTAGTVKAMEGVLSPEATAEPRSLARKGDHPAK